MSLVVYRNLEATPCIPRLIHQTWKTAEVPKHWESSRRSWEGWEGWTYQLWTDATMDAFMVEHYPWFVVQYRAYPRGIYRADAWRYFVLHHYGGIYVDLDIEAKPQAFRAFYELVKHQKVVLSQARHATGSQPLTNAIMMSQPQVDFWPRVWAVLQGPDSVRGWKRMVRWIPYFHVLMTTGPGIVCDAHSTYRGPHNIYVAPAGLLQPGQRSDQPPIDTTESVVKTLPGSSWHEAGSGVFPRMGAFFADHTVLLLGCIVAALVLVIVGLVVWRRR